MLLEPEHLGGGGWGGSASFFFPLPEAFALMFQAMGQIFSWYKITPLKSIYYIYTINHYTDLHQLMIWPCNYATVSGE